MSGERVSREAQDGQFYRSRHGSTVCTMEAGSRGGRPCFGRYLAGGSSGRLSRTPDTGGETSTPLLESRTVLCRAGGRKHAGGAGADRSSLRHLQGDRCRAAKSRKSRIRPGVHPLQADRSQLPQCSTLQESGFRAGTYMGALGRTRASRRPRAASPAVPAGRHLAHLPADFLGDRPCSLSRSGQVSC